MLIQRVSKSGLANMPRRSSVRTLTKWDKPGKTLATKFLEFLDQNGPSRWVQLERLVDLDSRGSRSARTGKVLSWLKKKQFVEKKIEDSKRRYIITNTGREELAHRKTVSLLAASAPYYFKSGQPLISFGGELTPEEQQQVADIFRKHPRLRNISLEGVEEQKKPNSYQKDD